MEVEGLRSRLEGEGRPGLRGLNFVSEFPFLPIVNDDHQIMLRDVFSRDTSLREKMQPLSYKF
jgi:hypothetical protein